MYDPIEVLGNIDDHQVAIIALCGAAMIFNYLWFFAAFRVARRDRHYSIPLFCTFFWLAHDASFVWRFDEWFHTYDHWYTKLFWVALVFTVLFEIAYIAQAITYGRDELLPSWSQTQFAALMVAGVIGALLVWSFVKHVLADPLYIASFDVANVAMPLLGPALLIRRGSTAGQSRVVWGGYLAMVTCWFTAHILWFGPAFQSFEYISLWVVCTVGCVGMLYALGRMPKYEPPSSGPSASPEPTAMRAPEGVAVAR